MNAAQAGRHRRSLPTVIPNAVAAGDADLPSLAACTIDSENRHFLWCPRCHPASYAESMTAPKHKADQ